VNLTEHRRPSEVKRKVTSRAYYTRPERAWGLIFASGAASAVPDADISLRLRCQILGGLQVFVISALEVDDGAALAHFDDAIGDAADELAIV
jgi:hypothetical protein